MSDSPYRVAPPRPPDRYVAGWRDLQRRRASMHAAAGAALALWGINLFTSLAAVRLAWLVAIVTTLALLARIVIFNCPRCGWRFTQKGWKERLFTTTCLHCGLTVGERQRQADAVEVDPEEQSARPQARVDVEAPPSPLVATPEDDVVVEPDESSTRSPRRIG